MTALSENLQNALRIACYNSDASSELIGILQTDGAIPTLTPGQIIVGNSLGVPTAVTMSGDATLSDTGVLTITGGAIGGSITANQVAYGFSSDVIQGSPNLVFDGSNLRLKGTLYFIGATSGDLNISAPATVTDYTLFLRVME